MRKPATILPTWSALGHLASVRLVSSMYIWLIVVPFLAKILSSLAGMLPIRIFDHEFNLNLSLPFSWELFYLSAVLFTLANLVFFFRAPRIVKDHATPKAFRDAGKGWDQLLSYRDDADYSEKAFNDNHAYVMGTKDDPTGDLHAMKETEHRYYALFWKIYEHANTQRRASLVLCTALYAMGLLAIAIVFLQNAHAVLRVTFS